MKEEKILQKVIMMSPNADANQLSIPEKAEVSIRPPKNNQNLENSNFYSIFTSIYDKIP